MGLGAIGVVLPLVPTTPFLLLGRLVFARSHRRFYVWLLDNRIFGPTARQWQEYRSIALRTKVLAVTLLVLTLGPSVVFFVPLWPVKVVLVAIGVSVIWFLVRLPTTAGGEGALDLG